MSQNECCQDGQSQNECCQDGQSQNECCQDGQSQNECCQDGQSQNECCQDGQSQNECCQDGQSHKGHGQTATVGCEAPNFKMDAVLGKGESLNRFGEISLEEIKKAGKWTVLYFYPLDFTFVCPTEIKRFNELYPEFKKLNSEVVAVSTDSIFSHLAWQESKALGRLEHPHASDKTMLVSLAYNVLNMEKGFSWRGTFIISPEGILMHASVNHGEGGRNVDEILRTLQVFQATARGEMVPCNWTPGDSFLSKN